MNISPSGVLIIRTESGAVIRDTGKEIFFSKRDRNARDVAEEYAKMRWGKMNREAENSFRFTPGKPEKQPDRQTGLQR